MTIRALKPKSSKTLGLMPCAAIQRPVSYFSDQLGIKFADEADDFDAYEIAVLSIDKGPPFALIHYRGEPQDLITVYLPRDLCANQGAQTAVFKILSAFNLPPQAVVWWSEGDGKRHPGSAASD